jgi:hypothetical protein
MGQESLTRFDQPKRKKKNNNKKRKPAGENAIVANQNKPANTTQRPANNKIIPNKKNEPQK